MRRRLRPLWCKDPFGNDTVFAARASKKGTATVRLRFTKNGRGLLRGRHKMTLKITGAGAATTATLRRRGRPAA